MPLGLRVGLTGGIAAGKSTVAAWLERHGVPVLDADQVAREVVRPGSAGLAELVDRLGPEILDGTGGLDRGALRRRIFSDPALRRSVEAVIHPRVRAAMARWTEATDAPYGVLVVPLLFESGMEDLVDRVLVVDAPERLQLQRVMERDRCDEAAARRILASQMDRAARRARADDCIVNDGDLGGLEETMGRLHRRYRALAAAHLPARRE